VISFYRGGALELARVACMLSGWASRHPRWSKVLIVVLLDLLLVVFGNTYYAFAAGSGDAPLSPFLPGGSLHDSAGIPVVNYMVLPIDRGGVFAFDNFFISSFIDPIWTGHIGAIAWMIWFLQWLLSFEWVQWIAAPFDGLAHQLQGFLGDVNWVPFALMITAGVAGIALLVGRKVNGGLELLISAVCAVLATGMLANPVASLTAAGGALDIAQDWGGQVAASVVTDDSTAALRSDDVLSEAVTTQLVDIFIRIPAQTLTFGHTLSGACETAFNSTMTSSPPVTSGDNAVKDAVSTCDPAAKLYVENPNFGEVGAAAVVSSGGMTLFLLAMALALLFIVTVLFFLIAAMKTMWNVYLGILPINRYPLWRSLADVFMGLASIVLMTVFMAAYLKILVAVLEASSGLGVVAQMMFVDLVVLVMVFLVWRVRRSAKKAGRSMAEQLSRLGLSGGGPAPRDSTNALLRMSTATNLANTFLEFKGRRALPAAASAATAVTNLGPAATGAFSQRANAGAAGSQAALGAGVGTAAAGKTANLVFTAVNIAKAAPGGPAAIAAQAAITAGGAVAQQVVSKVLQARSAPLAIEAPYRGPRRIAVGNDGVGHIERVAPPAPSLDLSGPSRTARSRRNDDVRELLSGARGA
jgi:hypothetical protein